MKILVLFILATISIYSQSDKTFWSEELPISQLSNNVIFSEAKLSIYVDYNNIDTIKGSIPAFIINDTKENYWFGKKKIWEYLLPEYLTDKNEWERLSKSEFGSGSCLFTWEDRDTIKKESFRKISLKYPKGNKKRKIRYKLWDYISFSSNDQIVNISLENTLLT